MGNPIKSICTFLTIWLGHDLLIYWNMRLSYSSHSNLVDKKLVLVKGWYSLSPNWMISVVTIWTKYIGAVHTLYQLLEEGGGGGLSRRFGWHNMWTAPYSNGLVVKHLKIRHRWEIELWCSTCHPCCLSVINLWLRKCKVIILHPPLQHHQNQWVYCHR